MIYMPHNLPDRSVGSTREPYKFRVDYYARPMDMSTATVTFMIVEADTGQVKLRAGLGSGDANGVVTYYPQPHDVDTPGLYRCQFRAAFGSSGAVDYVSPWLWTRIVRNVDVAPPPPLPPAWPPTPTDTYLTPPFNASPWNDEFRDGPAQLDQRDWQVISTVSGLPMRRYADVTTDMPTLAADEYNATITRAGLRVQCTSGMRLLKPFAPGLQLAAHISDPRGAGLSIARLEAANYAGAVDATSREAMLGFELGVLSMRALGPGLIYTTPHTYTPAAESSGYVVLLEAVQPALTSYTWRSALVEPMTGRIIWVDEVPIDVAQFETKFAGIEIETAPAPYSWVEIGFFRSYPLGSWFP